MRSLVAYLLALGALIFGAVFAFPNLFGRRATESTDTAQPNSPPPVVVARAVRAMFSDSIQALGTVIANESVVLTPNRADHVTAIHFADGQTVEANQLLVEMNAAEERALLTEAIAIRDERRLNAHRTEELFERRMISERERDTARSALMAADARVLGIEAGIADREIRAPFDGVLGLRHVSVGAFVQPSTVIATLDDLSVVKLDFTISGTWLASIAGGMKIEATSDAWPDTVFQGHVVTLDTRLDVQTRSITVRASLPNRDGKLRPGMLLKVRVQRGEVPVLQVPEEALIPIGADHFVMRVETDSVARRVEVVVGRRQPGSVEILEGLQDGDSVVIEGLVRVRPGAAVHVVATRAP